MIAPAGMSEILLQRLMLLPLLGANSDCFSAYWASCAYKLEYARSVFASYPLFQYNSTKLFFLDIKVEYAIYKVQDNFDL